MRGRVTGIGMGKIRLQRTEEDIQKRVTVVSKEGKRAKRKNEY